MELETIDKLFLELGQIATAKTAREIASEKREITIDEKILSNLILRGDDNKPGEISSGLTADFAANTNVFNVQYQDGIEYRVTVKMEKI